MEVDTNPTFDWANDAYLALNDMAINPSEKWPQFPDANQPYSPASFTIPPSLINHASVARYGQITPPEELSPAAPPIDQCKREDSIPVEQLRNEVPWPVEQKIQQLADYQPEQKSPPPQLSTPESQEDTSTRASKRRRTSKRSSSNQSAENPTSHQQPSTVNPQQPKRKRGRPKSQPQTIETYTSDGFPVQVTSARQSHLEKNRVAAHKCRQRKKEYIGSLEGRAREFSANNKALKENVAILREEVLELKNEVLRHAGCGFWAVDEYLARCAGDLLGMEGPSFSTSRQPSQTHSVSGVKTEPKPNMEAALSQEPDSPMSSMVHDDFDGFDFLNDSDEERPNITG